MENNRIRNMRVIPAEIRTDKRVAIYCHVSTGSDSQADSLEAQKYGLQQIVKSEPNWTLYRIYEDKGSGSNTGRLGFESMIWDSYDNKFDIILVKSISRFTRNTAHLLETVQKLRGLGIEVRFEQENISTNSNEQDLLIAVHTSMAQAQGESLSEATKWGLRRGFETGESKFYARKCFGYKHNEKRELIINDQQAIGVRMIFELYLKGYSVGMIMKDLEHNNIKSPTRKEKWSKRTIQTMLTNEKYIGNVILGKTYTGQYPNNKQKVNQGSQDRFLIIGVLLVISAIALISSYFTRQGFLEAMKEDGLNTSAQFTDRLEDNTNSVQALNSMLGNKTRTSASIINTNESASEMIQSIADQANLLVLNAAIEAARAGRGCW